MNAIWFMTTRGRPHQVRDLIAAFKAAGEVPPVAVMIDDDPKVYESIKFPAHWHIHVAPEHLEMTRAHNMLLGMYPGRACYGWFADHFRPLTPMFPALKAAADDWFMAWPNSEMSHSELAGAPTFGGKLIRMLEWINLPTTVHIATERPFGWLWEKLGIVKVLENERFTRTWPVGQGSVPRNYRGVDYNDDDARAYRKWQIQEAPRVIERIRAAMIADGYEFQDDGLIHPKHGCTRIGAGDWAQNVSFGNIGSAHAA